MESFDAVYTTEEIAQIFKCSPNAVRSMEDRGELHRLPGVPGVKFSGVEVAQKLGKDYNVQRLEAENRQLRRMVKDRDERLMRIGILVQGGGIQ